VSIAAAAMRQNEDEYAELIKRWRPESVLDFAACLRTLGEEMKVNPLEDLLGPFYMGFAEKTDHGEFYTPKPVARFMGQAAFDQAREQGETFHVLEPSCGSGVMVLEFVRAMLNAGFDLTDMYAEAWDLSRVACDMAYINLTTWSIPALIINGNTLEHRVIAVWKTPHLRLEKAS